MFGGQNRGPYNRAALYRHIRSFVTSLPSRICRFTWYSTNASALTLLSWMEKFLACEDDFDAADCPAYAYGSFQHHLSPDSIMKKYKIT